MFKYRKTTNHGIFMKNGAIPFSIFNNFCVGPKDHCSHQRTNFSNKWIFANDIIIDKFGSIGIDFTHYLKMQIGFILLRAWQNLWRWYLHNNVCR